MNLEDLLEQVNSKQSLLMDSWARTTSTMTDKPMVADKPSWKAFAEILYMGKHYE
jgi:hypothetical protein